MPFAYLEAGTQHSFTVVLLHGFCERKELWEDTIAKLKHHVHVLAPDLPGFGENEPVQETVTIEQMAEQLHAWLVERNIQQGVLVGHSLGGYISLAFADLFPEWMQGLCLFHSTAQADAPGKKEKRTQTAAFIEKNGMKPLASSSIKGLFFERHTARFSQEIARLTTYAAETAAASAAAVTKAMRDRPDRTDVLRQATYPVCFIAGKEDQAVELDSLKEQFYLSASSVSVLLLPETGHMGMFERKNETLIFLEAWVQQLISEK